MFIYLICKTFFVYFIFGRWTLPFFLFNVEVDGMIEIIKHNKVEIVKVESNIKSIPEPYEVTFAQKYKVYGNGTIYPVGQPFKLGGHRAVRKVVKVKAKKQKFKMNNEESM